MTQIKIHQEIIIPKGIERTISSSEEVESGHIHVRKGTPFSKAFKNLPSKNKTYLGLIAEPGNGTGTRLMIAHILGEQIIYENEKDLEIPLKLPQNFLDTEKQFRINNKNYTYKIGISNDDDIESLQKYFRALIYPIENFA